MPDEYAKMLRKAKQLAQKSDLAGIKRLQKKYFQWASAIRNVWEFERKKR